MDKLKDYITIKLIYAGMSKEEYKLIQCDVQEENRNSLMTFSAITVVFLLIMFCVSFVSVDVSTNRYVYLFVMILTAIMFVTAKRMYDAKHLFYLQRGIERGARR